MIYYCYWKYPELRFDISGKGPDGLVKDYENKNINLHPLETSNIYYSSNHQSDISRSEVSWKRSTKTVNEQKSTFGNFQKKELTFPDNRI